MNSFFRFPTTPHFEWLSNSPLRDDKVLEVIERDTFFGGTVTFEEKVDGANVGISWDENGKLQLQNRGSYICSKSNAHPQFERLWPWVYERYHFFEQFLGTHQIIFGEWCAYKHSVYYTQLPDWFLGFDVYDKSKEKFFSVQRRDDFFSQLNIYSVKKLNVCKFIGNVRRAVMETKSAYANAPIEGIYIRSDEGPWLAKRAKVVRPDFVQSISSHWKNEIIIHNKLAHE